MISVLSRSEADRERAIQYIRPLLGGTFIARLEDERLHCGFKFNQTYFGLGSASDSGARDLTAAQLTSALRSQTADFRGRHWTGTTCRWATGGFLASHLGGKYVGTKRTVAAPCAPTDASAGARQAR
jgi:hypothetical protein